MIPLIIQDQFHTIYNLPRSPIPQTSNWSGTIFAVSYSKPALVARWSRIFNLVIFYVAGITLCAFDIQEGNPPSTEGNRATNGQSGSPAGRQAVDQWLKGLTWAKRAASKAASGQWRPLEAKQRPLMDMDEDRSM